MTEERKQELRRLLEEAMGNLVVCQEYGGPLPLPVEVYGRYLQECWQYFGLDRFHPFWIRPTLHVCRKDTESRLLNYIKEELAAFIVNDKISVESYFIQSTATEKPRVYPFDNPPVQLDFILSRLLNLALVLGTEEAVKVFDRCSRPEGVHGFFQDVSIVEGLKLKTEIEVFKGIRLVPLVGTGSSAEVLRYFPGFPVYAFIREFSEISGQTLLVVDLLGLSMFHKPGANQEFQRRLPVDDLPFQVEEHESKFRNLDEVDSFQESFSQALALTLDFPIQIPGGGYCLEESQTFNPRDGTISSLSLAKGFRRATTGEEGDIEQAKRLYERLVALNSGDRKKLELAIRRWIRSKFSGEHLAKIIDLGIALEVLYLSDMGENRELSFRLRLRAAWHLGRDEEDRKRLLKRFGEIYNCRSNAVHNGELGRTVKSSGNQIPTGEFIEKSQNLCRESIMKVINDGGFPDWDSLILGGEVDR